MLRIVLEPQELFNEENQTFETLEGVVLDLEHSLVSVSKWESKYQKPFLAAGKKTNEELYGYIQAMIMTPDVSPDVLARCSKTVISQIQSYIDSSQTATSFGTMPERRGSGEVITSELIYYWMLAFNIPFECEHWHLNRLFALIRICNIKNSKPKKMSRRELAERNAEINRQRKEKLKTTG